VRCAGALAGPSDPWRCNPSRQIGALLMEDGHGVDEKILAVPVDELNPYYERVETYTDLPTYHA
jgi:inorganic pyrophosphatase